MSDKYFSRSPVHDYKIVSTQFERIRKDPSLSPEQVKSIAREIIALSSWGETEADEP